MALNRNQKRAVAAELISQAGNLVKNWEEIAAGNKALNGVSQQDASEVIGSWLYRLPGIAWDASLRSPESSRNG